MNQQPIVAAFIFIVLSIPFAWIGLGDQSRKTKVYLTGIALITMMMILGALTFVGITYFALNAVGEY